MGLDIRCSNGSVMKSNKDVSGLSNEDLPRYKDFLLDKILGEGQPAANRGETFRSSILDRVERTNEEISKRNEYECRNTGGCPSKQKN